MRFFAGSDYLEQASSLARDLLQGELAVTSPAVRASALAWCARMLFALPDRAEAFTVLDAARNLARTEEVSIAEAFADSYEGNTSAALNKLAGLNAPSSRAASFIIVANSRSAVESLDWLREAGLTLSDADSDGKLFIIRKQLDAGRFPDALESATRCDSNLYGPRNWSSAQQHGRWRRFRHAACKRRKAKTDHLVERRFRILLTFHD